MFRKLNEKLGLTIVIVTHDKELAKKVNRVVSIRDGKTSSERIMKNDYRERMEHLDIDWQEEETQEEFAVLDPPDVCRFQVSCWNKWEWMEIK